MPAVQLLKRSHLRCSLRLSKYLRVSNGGIQADPVSNGGIKTTALLKRPDP